MSQADTIDDLLNKLLNKVNLELIQEVMDL